MDDILKLQNYNQTLSDILSRTSVRQYEPDLPVPQIDVETLLRAAMAAPSAVNRQPWDFIVVDRRELLDELAEQLPYAKMLAHAPLAIVPCGNSDRFLDGTDSQLWVQDLSAASENILVAAHALGLGAVWTSVYPHPEREAAVCGTLKLPEGIHPLCVIPVGYPLHPQEPHDKWDPARVHHNSW